MFDRNVLVLVAGSCSSATICRDTNTLPLCSHMMYPGGSNMSKQNKSFDTTRLLSWDFGHTLHERRLQGSSQSLRGHHCPWPDVYWRTTARINRWEMHACTSPLSCVCLIMKIKSATVVRLKFLRTWADGPTLFLGIYSLPPIIQYLIGSKIYPKYLIFSFVNTLLYFSNIHLYLCFSLSLTFFFVCVFFSSP
jgi:hypothetical protein